MAIIGRDWYHVAVVGDGQVIWMFIDANQNNYGAGLTVFGTGDASAPLAIGALRNPNNAALGQLFMHGGIDEVHLFDKALSDAEIRLLANGSSPEEMDKILEPEDRYRYAYQGQFSERDLETGWNHFELREYDPIIARWTSKDPKGQFYSPYVGMGNNPVSGTDPDGGWLFGLFGSTSEQRQAARADKRAFEGAEINNYFSKDINVTWKGAYTQSPQPNLWSEQNYFKFTYNEDGTSQNVDLTTFYTSFSGTAELDYTIESFAIPFFKGASLIYNGTVRGVLKTSLGASRLGGSAARLNYYTMKAVEMGYSTTMTGARVRAGLFVQINHNIGRVLAGKGLKTLYSNSAATIIGRQMQNQAIGSGLLGVSVGTGSLYYNLNFYGR